jgi:hypothetical protein
MKTITTLIISLTAIIALAAGSAFGSYSGGTGDPNNPYQIATKADLLALAAATADYNNCFILTADINMGGQVFTTAIIAPDTSSSSGFQGTAFTGTFDGSGHKITGFTINANGGYGVGLFGKINSGGSVKNLGLENFVVVSGFCYVGGLVGCNNGGSISNCYSTGAVSGNYEVGGLVGWSDSSISNCYSTGSVSGSEDVGGLVGYSDYVSSVVSSFWDINTSGQTTSSGGTGKTTAQMKTLSTFTSAGWDFTTIWRMRCEGMNYPKLNWQVIPTADWVCPDGVDFADFAYFAEWWQTTGCDSSNNFCDGTDMDSSGTVDMQDLVILAANWLSGE